MSATSREELHHLIDTLSDEEVLVLRSSLETQRSHSSTRSPRPLSPDDIVRPEPILPDCETADDMIATIRRWRREGGYV